MRIIAGKYRGRRLQSPPSRQTRPTSDRLRETLFNILAPRIEGTRLLDLCAGTGAVGIEALSRGASHATFVDHSRKMCALIEENLNALKIESEKVTVANTEVITFLKKCGKQIEPSIAVGLVPRVAQSFDMIFFDPPYAADYEAALNLIAKQAGKLLSENGVVVVEHHKKTDLADAFGALQRYRTLKQGDSVLSFYRVGQ